jgi:DNA-binding protein YbaB
MPDSVDASDEMIDNWTKRLEENAARYQALADRVQGQTITERSKDGMVTVTVDSRGLLKNLVIAEAAAGGKRMAEVSAQVMQLVQRAQARIPELLQQAMTETTGTGDQAAAEIVREAQSTFPEPPPEPSAPEPDRGRRFLPEDNDEQPPAPPRTPPAPPQQPPPRRRRAVDEDDDDGFGGPILA